MNVCASHCVIVLVQYLRLGGDPYGNLVEVSPTRCSGVNRWCSQPLTCHAVAQAVEKDPEFTMGHASMALFQLLSNVPPSSDDVKQCVDAAHALVGKGMRVCGCGCVGSLISGM